MKAPLRVLVVEDSEFDAQIMTSLIRKAGYDVTMKRVETRESMEAALGDQTWDVILADYNLPEFDAPTALAILQKSGLDLPFLIVSGGIGEDIAVAAMKAGAHDYLMKGNLQRLAPAVARELREAANRASQREAKRALLENELRYRLLWETCPDAVILMDAAGQIYFANPAVRTVFGYLPMDLVGKNLALLQTQHRRPSDIAGLTHYLEGKTKSLHRRAVEAMGRRKDGMEIDVEVSFSDMELDGQRRFVAFIRDITERKRAQKELQENKEQFQVAREIQQRLFPKSAPAFPGYDIAGASYPADATGGDYFDYLPMLNNRLGIVVGDVTGHGVGPALLMAETRAYLRLLAARREDVGVILTRVNRILAEDMGGERFITLCMARLESTKPAMIYSSAGHPAGYIMAKTGEIRTTLPRIGVPLGLRPDTVYSSSKSVPLKRGDVVLLLTDGIEESMSTSNELFGIDRILAVVRENRDKSAYEILDALYRAVREFSGEMAQIDDITAVVFKVR